jgi:hypothetical protein
MAWSRVSPRRATHFLLLRQKKVSKEKATLLSASPALRSGATCGAQRQRGLARTHFAQTIASPDPLAFALLSAYRRAFNSPTPTPQVRAMARTCLYFFFLARSGWAEQRKRGRDQGCACLSEASLRRPPSPLSSAGCPERSGGTQTAGRLSFGYFSLAKQRKVPRPPGRDPAFTLRRAGANLCSP